MYPNKSLAAAIFAGSLSATAGFAQNPTGELRFSQTASHEVLATAIGEVAQCGVTALPDAPTFRVSGQVVDIVQHVAGVACRADVAPGALRPYRATVNLGHLAPGRYTVNWNFPKLSANYEIVSGE